MELSNNTTQGSSIRSISVFHRPKIVDDRIVERFHIGSKHHKPHTKRFQALQGKMIVFYLSLQQQNILGDDDLSINTDLKVV